MYRIEADTARDVAREAAEVAADLQGRVAVREKHGNNGLVTDADLAVEELILTRLRGAFPDDALLSEETLAATPPGAARLWCIDPIDGTSEYAQGLDEFAVQLGLLVAGRPVAGAVALPGTGEVFWGFRGGGAWRQAAGSAKEPFRLEPWHESEPFAVIHSRSHRGPRLEQALTRLGAPQRIAAGSVGYKVGQLLLGRAQLYLHPGRGARWWDTAGPVAVLRAAGGEATDLAGRELEYETPDDADAGAVGITHSGGMLLARKGLAHHAARLLGSRPG